MADLAIRYNRDELGQRIPFQIIVENFNRRYSTSPKRRSYLVTFTLEERKEIRKWYKIFYGWYLTKGIPKSYTFTAIELELIDRMENWFGDN